MWARVAASKILVIRSKALWVCRAANGVIKAVRSEWFKPATQVTRSEAMA